LNEKLKKILADKQTREREKRIILDATHGPLLHQKKEVILRRF
jgi:hypothetical protein